MARYSIALKERLFVKSYYGFLSFAKNMGKDICRNVSRNLKQ